MDYEIVPAKSVRLNSIAKNEAWLEAKLREDPSLLGPDFEEVEYLTSQKSVPGGGRLDLLLHDERRETRYVVELMLGPLDESHIVRTIEYWDIERRRYPAYRHIAVIVAEDIESRYLNVLSLLAGNIPLIAMKLNAITLDRKLLLQFTKVLDLRELRRDDTTESSGGGSDRETWQEKTTPEALAFIDSMVRLLQKQQSGLELSYLIHYLGFRINGVSRNFATFKPKKKWLDINFYGLTDVGTWQERFRNAKLETEKFRDTALWVRLLPADLAANRELVEGALKECAASS